MTDRTDVAILQWKHNIAFCVCIVVFVVVAVVFIVIVGLHVTAKYIKILSVAQ